jgi:hypothetical protein
MARKGGGLAPVVLKFGKELSPPQPTMFNKEW